MKTDSSTTIMSSHLSQKGLRSIFTKDERREMIITKMIERNEMSEGENI
jgi:hypothetical protein